MLWIFVHASVSHTFPRVKSVRSRLLVDGRFHHSDIILRMGIAGDASQLTRCDRSKILLKEGQLSQLLYIDLKADW